MLVTMFATFVKSRILLGPEHFSQSRSLGFLLHTFDVMTWNLAPGILVETSLTVANRGMDVNLCVPYTKTLLRLLHWSRTADLLS